MGKRSKSRPARDQILALPVFRYHPDPIATGSVKPSKHPCGSCNQERGFFYEGSIFGPGNEASEICPWCIADGKAATRFNLKFSDEYPLVKADLPRQTIIEVTRRTPGYASWQQGEWQVCCEDACAFHGDASVDNLRQLEGKSLARFHKRYRITPDWWEELLEAYVPGGGVSVFRFVCLHCDQAVYALDLA